VAVRNWLTAVVITPSAVASSTKLFRKVGFCVVREAASELAAAGAEAACCGDSVMVYEIVAEESSRLETEGNFSCTWEAVTFVAISPPLFTTFAMLVCMDNSNLGSDLI
jgi:hypothetical protein